MKKVLVTGGAGYIGSHTIVQLVEAGYNPIIIDNLCNTSIKNINGIKKITGKNVKWHNVNCTDKIAMQKIFKQEGKVLGVIHSAAYKSIVESFKNPDKYYKNNLGSLEVLLECMKENEVENIIFSSSCTVYGVPDILPISEDTPFKKAESVYGETKQLCEKILLDNTCNSVALRYFNPIGSHKSVLIGDYSLEKASNIVPIITETAIGKRKKMTVFGNDYNTPDGTCIRDYIHVVDLARSHVLAMEFILSNSGKHAFNVGTGIGISVLELIHIFEKANKVKLNYMIGDRRKGDIEEIYADGELVKSKLGWKAQESLKEAMISAWDWEKSK